MRLLGVQPSERFEGGVDEECWPDHRLEHGGQMAADPVGLSPKPDKAPIKDVVVMCWANDE